MPDPVTLTVIAAKAAASIGKASLVDTIRDAAVGFLSDQAESFGKKELADRIAGLRSDATLREQIKTATERAVKRWVEDYADRDLVLAVANDTKFADLPAVREAVQTIAKRPFDPIAADTLTGKFAQVLPGNFESPRVERGVIAFLEILREELAGVSALRDALSVAAEIQTARSSEQSNVLLERIEASLRRIEQGPTATEKTLQDYLTWVIDQHRYLDPRGTMQTVRQVQVLLEEIYVSLQAEAEPVMDATDRRLFESEMEAFMKRDDLRPEEREDLRENLLIQYTREAKPQTGKIVELADLVHDNSKLVILGDPGAGKTTLLRYLALQNAQALRRGNTGQAGGTAPTDARLPVYMRLANYAEHGKGRALADYVPACIRGESDSDRALADLIKTKLAEGTSVVLFDGLVEVIDPSDRAEIAQQVDAFIRAHERAGNCFVVTSRVAGYRTAPLSGDIPHYRVCDMNDEQVYRFLERWCRAVEHSQTPDLSPVAQDQKAQAEIDGISQAIAHNPGVRRLAANPLLLRVLALIHRTGARLPQRRIELYRLAADTLIRDWQLARGIPEKALVREADANRLLAEIAAWMHESKPAGIATEGEVRGKLADVVAGLYGKEPDHPDVQTAVSDFLSRIRQHTGLFVERAPRRFGFMHLTFEEYFAARWLVAKPRDAARRIRNKLHRPRWEEPILLAIGFYGMEFPDDVSDLVEQAILAKDLGGPSPYEDILHRDQLFALRVLGDQDGSVALRQKIVTECFQLWMDELGRGKYELLRHQLAQIIKEIQDSIAGKDLTDRFLVALRRESTNTRASAAHALASMPNQPQVIAALIAALQDKSELVRRSASDALTNATDQPQVVTTLIAALKDKKADVRGHVAYALRTAISQQEVVSALLSTLRDTNAYVRARTAAALRDSTSQPEVVDSLLTALNNEDEDIRGRAATILSGATAQPEVVTALLASIHDESDLIRGRAANSLRKATSQSQVVVALLTALQDQSANVRDRAAFALRSATTTPEVMAALLTALRDENINVRRSVSYALSNSSLSPEAITYLLTTLRDERPGIRRSAVDALSNTTTQPTVTSALLAVLDDRSDEVRAIAAHALSNATSYPNVVTSLCSALSDDDAFVRASAAFALGNAPFSSEVIHLLLTTLDDDAKIVLGSAAEALAHLCNQIPTSMIDDFPQQIAGNLRRLNLDARSPFTTTRAQDSLFEALAAVAPGPVV